MYIQDKGKGVVLLNKCDYVEKMNSVNTDGVEETSQVTGLISVMREDKIIDSGIDENLVGSAPESGNGYVKVPKVL